jgi:hypothetical protein
MGRMHVSARRVPFFISKAPTFLLTAKTFRAPTFLAAKRFRAPAFLRCLRAEERGIGKGPDGRVIYARPGIDRPEAGKSGAEHPEVILVTASTASDLGHDKPVWVGAAALHGLKAIPQVVLSSRPALRGPQGINLRL